MNNKYPIRLCSMSYSDFVLEGISDKNRVGGLILKIQFTIPR